MTNRKKPNLDTRVKVYIMNWEMDVCKELQALKVKLMMCQPSSKAYVKAKIETLVGVLDLLQGRKAMKTSKLKLRKEITSLKHELQMAQASIQEMATSLHVQKKINFDFKIQLHRQFKVTQDVQKSYQAVRNQLTMFYKCRLDALRFGNEDLNPNLQELQQSSSLPSIKASPDLSGLLRQLKNSAMELERHVPSLLASRDQRAETENLQTSSSLRASRGDRKAETEELQTASILLAGKGWDQNAEIKGLQTLSSLLPSEEWDEKAETAEALLTPSILLPGKEWDQKAETEGLQTGSILLPSEEWDQKTETEEAFQVKSTCKDLCVQMQGVLQLKMEVLEKDLCVKDVQASKEKGFQGFKVDFLQKDIYRTIESTIRSQTETIEKLEVALLEAREKLSVEHQRFRAVVCMAEQRWATRFMELKRELQGITNGRPKRHNWLVRLFSCQKILIS